MKIRYKNTKVESAASQFNTHAIGEVLTSDDSVFIKDLDVCIDDKWKDMLQAFRDKDIIPDNYNEWFREPKTPEEKERGYIV